MSVIVFSNEPKFITEALPLAQALNHDKIIGITVFSENLKEVSSKGFDKIYYTKENLLNDQWVHIINEVFDRENANYVISVNLKNNIEILASFSAIKNIVMLTNVINFEKKDDKLLFSRPVLGGKAISLIEVSKEIKLAITVQPKKFKLVESLTNPEFIEITNIPKSKILLKSIENKVRSKANIEDAEIVIGVGRGFKKKEDLNLAFELAELLNAQVGCSRPIAADYKWLPDDVWIGVSGKSIHPKLYIAIGISGAPQHISGILDSKIIVSINNDKNSLISKYSDYFVVADLYKFLPVLINKIKNLKK